MTGGVEIRWLGQAGFEIVSPGGVRVAIDPYLGDSCMELVGFKRMSPAPVAIEAFQANALLISHEHPDHLDIDLLRHLANRPQVQVYGNAACRETLRKAGLDPARIAEIHVGDEIPLGDIRIRALPCDHGDQCVEPLGFLLETGGTSVYFSGDTAYSPDMLRPAIDARPDVALLPINGMYGNLNWESAAALAQDLRCKLVIPCHFWTFVEHGGDPLAFRRRMEQAPGTRTVFLAPGERIRYDKEDARP